MSVAGELRENRRMRRLHAVQREIARVLAPLWVLPAAAWIRLVRRYRVERLQEVRAEFRRIRAEFKGPLLICANHLTLIDSMLVAYALAPSWRYVVEFDSLPWNTPERQNFAADPFSRVVSYVAKCIPITRGGSREGVAAVLKRVMYLLSAGELALVFPEGGRSRSGRVEADGAGWGVGRIAGALPGCRVLCVYLRGRAQEAWGRMPERGDRIHVDLACIEPKSDFRGARRSRDLADQILGQLRSMEGRFFDGR